MRHSTTLGGSSRAEERRQRKSAGRKIISHLNRIFARVRQERSVSSVWSIWSIEGSKGRVGKGKGSR